MLNMLGNMSKEAQRTTDKERNQGRTVTRDQNLKGREGQSKTTSSQTVRRQKMSLVGQKEEQAVRKENERQTTHTTQKTKLQLTQVFQVFYSNLINSDGAGNILIFCR